MEGLSSMVLPHLAIRGYLQFFSAAEGGGDLENADIGWQRGRADQAHADIGWQMGRGGLADADITDKNA